MAETLKICGTSAAPPIPSDPSADVLQIYANTTKDGVKITWTFPAINSHAVSFYRLYRSATSEFDDATLHVSTAGDEYYDIVEDDQVGNTYYYWIQYVSVSGTVSSYFGPAIAIAGNWVSKVIEAISGEIKASDLAESLRSEIETIPSLRTQILDEKTGRLAAIEDIEFTLEQFDLNVEQVRNDVINEAQQSSNGLQQLATSIEGLDVSNGQIAAQVIQERLARVDAISAEASARELLAVETDNNAAAILNEASARSDAISSEAEARELLQTQTTTALSNTAALIEAEQTARTSALSAEAAARETLGAETIAGLAANTALIEAESTARTSAIDAEATAREQVAAQTNENKSAIETEVTARTTAISAEAQAREALSVRTEQAEADIVTNKTLAANDAGALATQINTVVANQVNTFRQDQAPTEEEGRKLDSIWIDTDDDNHLKQWDGSSWVSMRDGQIADAFAAIQSEQTARTTATSSLATDLTTIESSVTTVAGDLVQAKTDIETETQEKLDTLNTALGNDLISNLASAKSYADDEALAAKQAAVADAQAALDAAKTNLETKIETDIADFDSVTAQQIIDAASDLSIYIDEIDDTITVNPNGSINLPDGRTLQVNGGATIPGKQAVYNRAGRLEHANGDIVSGASDVLIKAENVRGTLLRLARATADITTLRDVTIDAKITDNNTTAVGFCMVDGKPATAHDNKFDCLWTDEALTNPRPNAQWLPLGSIADVVRGVEINTSSGGTVKIQDRMQAYDTGLEDVEDLADGLKAEYTLKIDADPNGTGDNIIGGFGLALSDTDSISAGFNVDKFWVGNVGDTYDSQTLPFFIQGGNTYINSAYIADATIGVAQIIDASISVAKIQDAAITTAKIKNGAIESAKIGQAQIKGANIDSLAVTGAHIDNATITSAKIGVGEIDTANIATAAITSAKIGNAAITSAKIDDAAITSAKIKEANIDTLRIAGNAITLNQYLTSNVIRNWFNGSGWNSDPVSFYFSLNDTGVGNSETVSVVLNWTVAWTAVKTSGVDPVIYLEPVLFEYRHRPWPLVASSTYSAWQYGEVGFMGFDKQVYRCGGTSHSATKISIPSYSLVQVRLRSDKFGVWDSPTEVDPNFEFLQVLNQVLTVSANYR